MRALTVRPGASVRVAVEEVPEPPPSDGSIQVEAIAVGVCGTDREIVDGHLGAPPPGRDRWVIGHESLGRVAEAPAGSGFEAGDLVVGVVRRPDPFPCASCAAGEWDMCSDGRFTEHGIAGRDGFVSERFRLDPAYAFKIDPGLGAHGVLVEPAGVLAKAWEQVDRVGARVLGEPRRVLVAGAGPIGSSVP
jgi:threonine dehydrogenase-like Zn-dependent dehydrogenase